MVAERDRIGAGGEEAVRHAWREAEPVTGVFAIDHGEVDPQLTAQLGQVALHRLTSGPADHIA